MKIFLILFLSQISFGAPLVQNRIRTINIQADYQNSPEPLTTEKLWTLEPDEPNPHRQRWVVTRSVDFVGLKSLKLGEKRFGVTFDSLKSSVVSYIRPAGPWYRPFDEFPCGSGRVDRFATEEGTRLAVEEAAQLWDDRLSSESSALGILLSRIDSDYGETAVKRAQQIFRIWLNEVSAEWKFKDFEKVRASEWKHYQEQASAQRVCAKKKSDRKTLPRWEEMMEPIPPAPPPERKILARAPVRRWNGVFSIRVNVEVVNQKLDGKLLLDSGAPKSIISPVWLDMQGIDEDWVSLSSKSVNRFFWSGGSALGKAGSVDGMEVAGLPIPLTNFGLLETDFYDPPETAASCCDGILGTDFLQKMVVEFHPGPPAEVVIWPRDGFYLYGVPWAEMRMDDAGELVSDNCGVGSGAQNFSGISWDTGSESTLIVDSPAASRYARWNLTCHQQNFGQKLRATFSRPEFARRPERSISAEAGIPLLSRGSVYFDLPHGRIWFDPKGLSAPVLENQSGLKLQYIDEKGDRILKVASIDPKSPARALLREGLRKGQTILQVDDKDAGDIDEWEVDRRLAGAYGNSVALQWKVRDEMKTVKFVLPTAAATVNATAPEKN